MLSQKSDNFFHLFPGVNEPLCETDLDLQNFDHVQLRIVKGFIRFYLFFEAMDHLLAFVEIFVLDADLAKLVEKLKVLHL